MPTLTTLLYFYLIPIRFPSRQQYGVMSIVFIGTYIIPLLLMIILKKIRVLKSYQVKSYRDVKLVLLIFILTFLVLGGLFYKIPNLIDFSNLFLTTAVGLFFLLLLSFFKIKTSFYVFSLAVTIGFFISVSEKYSYNFLPIIIILILSAGIVASVLLKTQKRNPREMYLGFFIGIFNALLGILLMNILFNS